MGFFGLVGMNMFCNTNQTGNALWQMALNEGGGNPGMKHNPIYVRKDSTTSEENTDTKDAVEEKENATESDTEVEKEVEAVETEPETLKEESQTEEVTEQPSENKEEQEQTEA